MNIYAKKGDEVKFIGQNGYEYELEFALKTLVVGEIYTVHHTDVHSSSTDVYLEGYDRPWNSVMFEDYMPQPTTNNLEGWENFTIKIPSKRDGKEVEFTLEQLFNDLEFGNAVAEDLQLPYKKRLEAFNWLKSNVKQFISDLRKHDMEKIQELEDEIKELYLDMAGAGR